jgi:hypothetical protein
LVGADGGLPGPERSPRRDDTDRMQHRCFSALRGGVGIGAVRRGRVVGPGEGVETLVGGADVDVADTLADLLRQAAQALLCLERTNGAGCTGPVDLLTY